MISTSNEWKNLLSTDELLPESDVNVVCNDDVTDTSNTTYFSVSSNSLSSLSNLQSFLKSADNIAQRNPRKIATLEWNFFALDGKVEIANNNTAVNRYISNSVCDENGVFSTAPTISYGYNGPASGVYPKYVSFKFDNYSGTFPTSIKLNGGSNISINSYDDTYKIVQNSGSTNNGTTLYINSWSMPFRRARISEFLLGARLFFDKPLLSKFKHQRTTDMVCAELPQNDCNFSVLDINCEWDVNNPNAKLYSLVNNDSIFKIYYGYKLSSGWEYILADTLVVKSFERPSNGIEANFVLESDINRANETFINTDEDNNSTIWSKYSTLLNAIANKSNLTFYTSTIKHDYFNPDSSNFDIEHPEATPLYRKFLYALYRGQLPNQPAADFRGDSEYYSRKMKEWIQLIAATMNAYIRRRPNGTIDIIGLLNYSTGYFESSTIIDSISLNNCFEYPEIERMNKISAIKVTLKPLNDDCELDRTYQGNPKYRYKFSYNNDGVLQTAENHLIMISIDSDYLRGYHNSDNIHKTYARYLYRFISEAKKIKADCRVNPAWQVGDLIGIELKNGQTAKGYIIDLDIEYAGYPKGNVTILAPKALNP